MTTLIFNENQSFNQQPLKQKCTKSSMLCQINIWNVENDPSA